MGSGHVGSEPYISRRGNPRATWGVVGQGEVRYKCVCQWVCVLVLRIPGTLDSRNIWHSLSSPHRPVAGVDSSFVELKVYTVGGLSLWKIITKLWIPFCVKINIYLEWEKKLQQMTILKIWQVPETLQSLEICFDSLIAWHLYMFFTFSWLVFDPLFLWRWYYITIFCRENGQKIQFQSLLSSWKLSASQFLIGNVLRLVFLELLSNVGKSLSSFFHIWAVGFKVILTFLAQWLILDIL